MNNVTYIIAMMKPLISHKDFVSIKINKISKQELREDSLTAVHRINVCPENIVFNYNLNNINNDWLINLSNTDIPDKAKFLLQLGQCWFNLSNNVTNKEKNHHGIH